MANVIREDVIHLGFEVENDGIDELTDQIGDLSDGLDDLADNDPFEDLIASAREFENETAGVTDGIDDIGNSQGIDRVRSGFQQCADAAGKFGKSVKDGIKKGADAMGKFGEKVVGAGKKVENLGKSFGKISAVAGAKLTAMVVMASTFEDSMAKVSTIADSSQLSLEDMQKQILDLSNSTGISANDIADATYNAISAGQQTGDAVNFVSNATSLARAGFTDTGAAIDILTTIMNAYGLEAEKVGSVSDMLIQTQNKGKTTVAELASAMGKVIPTANSMGVGLEQLTASYAIMTAKGIATAESTTYMNSMLNELGKAGTSASEILKQTTGKSFQELIKSGKSVGDVLQILQDYANKTGKSFGDLWGSAEAGKAGLTLLSSGVEEYNSMVAQMLDSTGSTAEALGKLETPSQKAKVAINQLKNVGIEFGQTILVELTPYIDRASAKFTEFTKKITNLSPETKKMIFVILGIVAALSPVLIIVGKLMQTFGGILTYAPKIVSFFGSLGAKIAALGGPVIAIVAIIAVLVAAFVHLWKSNEGFREGIICQWEALKNRFEEFVSGIVDRINELGFNFESFADIAKTVWDEFCNYLAPIFEGLMSQINIILSSAMDIITGLLDVFIGLFTGDWDQMWQGVEEIFAGAWELIKNTFENIVQTLEGVLDVFCGWFGQNWQETWETAVDFCSSLWDSLCQNVSNILDSIVGFFTEKGDSIIGFWSGLWNNIVTAVSGVWNNIVTAVSVGWNAVVTALSNVANWFDTNIITPIKNAFNNCIFFIVGLFVIIYEKIVEVLTPVINWINTNIIEPIKMMFNILWQAIVAIAQSIYQGIIDAWNAMSQWVNDNIVQPVVEFFTALWNEIVIIAQSIYQGIIDAWQSLSGWVDSNVIQPIIKFFKKLWQEIVRIAKRIYEGIVNAWNTIASWVNNNVIEPIKRFFSDLWSSITGGVNTAKDSITSAFKSAYNVVTGAWSGITEFFSGIWKSVSETVEKIIGKGKEALGVKNDVESGEVKQVVKGRSTSDTWGGKPIKHADGGLITAAHFGVVGEAGPEMIIPLSSAKRDRGIDLWNQAGYIMGVSGIAAYEPGDISSNVSTHTENSTYAPVFNLTINGGDTDRNTEQKVKQWIKESMDEVFKSIARQNPRLREV